MTYAQALTLIEIRVERERKANEAARTDNKPEGWFDPTEFTSGDLPTANDVVRLFSRQAA